MSADKNTQIHPVKSSEAGPPLAEFNRVNADRKQKTKKFTP